VVRTLTMLVLPLFPHSPSMFSLSSRPTAMVFSSDGAVAVPLRLALTLASPGFVNVANAASFLPSAYSCSLSRALLLVTVDNEFLFDGGVVLRRLGLFASSEELRIEDRLFLAFLFPHVVSSLPFPVSTVELSLSLLFIPPS
jgi:hypothetical protein